MEEERLARAEGRLAEAHGRLAEAQAMRADTRPQPKEQGEIPTLVEGLEKNLAILREALSDLHEKLEPVLGEDHRPDTPRSATAPDDTSTSLGRLLLDAINDVQGATGVVRSLEARLEL